MLKKDWKKNLLRVKQLADQGLGRAEKSEVLSEELLSLEKRVELIRQVCHSTHKKVGMCLQTAGLDREKRLRKMPESQLAVSMLESAEQLGIDTLLGQMFQLCGNAINTVANDLLQYELNVENGVLAPVQGLLDNDIPAIQKQRKHLNKFTIDMDVARSRYQSVVKQNHAGNASAAKTDNFRDEMEDTAHRVEQCRDQLSTDMYAFLARESEYSGYLLEMVKASIQYHQRSLDVLERLVPQMEEQIVHSTHSPVYGVHLEEHLRRSNRDIAVVIEDCVCTLLEVGMEEEGLFRVAGSSSKVKKLKAAFDFGMVDMSEHVRDIHCVAGALKLYLRELPEPLMTFSLYSEWMHAARISHVDQKLPALWQVINQLPKINYNNLRYLIKFLAKLAEQESVNKMSASNIAIVMGPNLIWAPGDGGPNVLNTSIQSAIVELLITYADYFFEGDVDFHKTGFGLSPNQGRSSLPPLPIGVTVGMTTLPRIRPKSTHAINSSFTLAKTALVAPPTPSQQHERSRSVPPFSTFPRTPPRSASQKVSAPMPVVNGAERTSWLGSGSGAASPPTKASSLCKEEKSASSLSSDDSVGASSSRRASLRTVTAKDNITADSDSLGGGDSSSTRFTNYWSSDSISEPGSLAGILTKKDLEALARSTTPPPKPPPPKSVHSDVYNTVFALHSLSQNDGWSEYLTTVRGMLDGHMTKKSSGSSLNSNGGAATPEVDFGVTSASSSQGSPVSLATNGSGTAQYGVEPQQAQQVLTSPIQTGAGMSPLKPHSPTGSLSSSQDNLLQATSPTEGPGSISPRAPRRGTKKPAPLPPPGAGAATGWSTGSLERGYNTGSLERGHTGSLERGHTGSLEREKPVVVERPAVAEKPPYAHSMSTVSTSSSGSGDGPHVVVSPPIMERSGSTTPLVERPAVPPPAPPARPEKPSSPLPERPRSQPPDRPSMPPPDRPPPSLYPNLSKEKEEAFGSKPEKPDKPEKPAKPAGMADGHNSGTLGRGSSRPPRPTPPPPPPPERRSSAEKSDKQDKQAPLAVAEEDGIGYGSPEPSPKSLPEETHQTHL